MPVLPNPLETDAGPFRIRLSGAAPSLHPAFTLLEANSGVYRIRLTLHTEQEEEYPALRLEWSVPILEVQGLWHPAAGRSRGLPPDWWSGFSSMATYSAPVVCLYGGEGTNRLTFAFSDALNPVTLQAGVNEETACFHCSVTLFAEPGPARRDYTAELRLDTRPHSYAAALREVADWWKGQTGCESMPVPGSGREPMYSTWYSFHQELDPAAVEEQCRLAWQLGCKAVLLDDGWQTSDLGRGYAHCGDWQVSPAKIPDMKAHIGRIHDLGLKALLWYSVPFVGTRSEAWSRFRDKLLYFDDSMGAGVLDPRYPEVREYLIRLYEQALLDWDLDGFKLDFVDAFRLRGEKQNPEPMPTVDAPSNDGGRDTPSVPEAVDRLLTGVMQQLRRIKPDILIEFRQNYIGPLMRKYGNLFRAADCPNDAVENRLHTLDLRLLSGSTAVHADMLMWNPAETAESAALQVIAVLFAVPQISVKLDGIPDTHRRMLAFWLGFWREHRDVLLDGTLEPRHPELLFPLVVSRTADKLVAAFYQDTVGAIEGPLPRQVIAVNGTQLSRLILETEGTEEEGRLQVFACTGELVREERLRLPSGLYRLAIPPAGCAIWTRPKPIL
ncbi:glycoside hydrolase family 36 protein [Gorillibacterium sp. sgz500922]|uniref:glycoside hydrolase family 36 protein n=1 Tax=Gorillibacterium sp. sgz500922 TaxID=3446694 RepID=UPI003F6786B3